MLASCGLPPHLDVSSDDPEKVKRGEEFLNIAVSVARDLGSTQLSGPIYSGHQKFPALPTKKNWQTSVGVLTRVAEKANASGISLCLEVLNRYETNLINTIDQGLAFINDAGADNIMLHIDTYHMNIEEADSAKAILQAGKHIGYVHLGENNRGTLGSGQINFVPVFDALLAVGYSGVASVEAFYNAAMGENLRAVLAAWRDVWTDDMAFARQAKDFMDMQSKAARQRAAH